MRYPTYRTLSRVASNDIISQQRQQRLHQRNLFRCFPLPDSSCIHQALSCAKRSTYALHILVQSSLPAHPATYSRQQDVGPVSGTPPILLSATAVRQVCSILVARCTNRTLFVAANKAVASRRGVENLNRSFGKTLRDWDQYTRMRHPLGTGLRAAFRAACSY